MTKRVSGYILNNEQNEHVKNVINKRNNDRINHILDIMNKLISLDEKKKIVASELDKMSRTLGIRVG